MSAFSLRSGATCLRARLMLLGVVLTSATAALAQSGGYVAQILIQTDQLVDAQTLRALKPADRARLQASGIQILDQEQVLRSAPRPLSGHWVEIGKRRYMTDRQGFLHLPQAPATLQNLKVFAQVGDKTPIGTLPDVKIVPEGQTPTPSTLTLKFKLKPEMNPPVEEKGPPKPEIDTRDESPAGKKCKRAACAKGNAKGCCVDYDGPFGDGKPYNRKGGPDCSARGTMNFFQSTCYLWSFVKTSAACANESAYPWNPKGRPNCYDNHKYRNCQNLDENDLRLMPARVTVRSGKSTMLTVRNNTPSNSTCLRVSGGPGKPTLKLPSSQKGKLVASDACGGQRLDHFSDSAKAHYETMQVAFVGPKLPGGECEGRYQVLAEGGGLTEKIDVLVTGEGCTSARIEFSLTGRAVTEEDVKQGSSYSGHRTRINEMTYDGEANLQVREDSDKANPSFDVISGRVSARWTLSDVERGTGQNAQGCKYESESSLQVGLSGSRDLKVNPEGQSGVAIHLTVEEDGSYRLNIQAPTLDMEGEQKDSAGATPLTPQCVAQHSPERKSPRTEMMVVRFDGISGRLDPPSVYAIAGFKPIEYAHPLGVPMKGTLRWKISW